MTIAVELITGKREAGCCEDTELPGLPTETAQQLTEDLQLLAHPVRLQILAILSRSAANVCVCDLEAALPVKQPTVSHHLKLLRHAGLIDCERQGLWAHYFVRRAALTTLRQRIVAQFDALG
jgi:ArsR family transcriptional regulator, arsenate/arsenite/antimonite-responsive transcriptional repressor